MKRIIFLLILGMSFVSVSKVTLAQDKQENVNFEEGKREIIRGVVIKYINALEVDGPCFIGLDVNGKTISVDCGRGWQRCSGKVDYTINEGDKVEVYGEVVGKNSVSICPSEEFYIKIIKERRDFCGSSSYGKCSSDTDCIKSGCSGQYCQSKYEEQIVTTCEYKDCYNSEAYNLGCKCAGGKCQWIK